MDYEEKVLKALKEYYGESKTNDQLIEIAEAIEVISDVIVDTYKDWYKE